MPMLRKKIRITYKYYYFQYFKYSNLLYFKKFRTIPELEIIFPLLVSQAGHIPVAQCHRSSIANRPKRFIMANLCPQSLRLWDLAAIVQSQPCHPQGKVARM